jgi:TRAP-type C4-dicarboxylate transport system substrate-binding protein
MNSVPLCMLGLRLSAALIVVLPLPAHGQALLHAVIEGKEPWPGPKVEYAGPPIEMRFSNPWPPVSQLVRASNELAAALERVTDGKIKVKTYHGGTLVPRPEGFRAPRGDVTDLSGCYTEDERTMTGMHIFQLPGILPPNPTAGTRIINEIQAKHFNAEFRRLEVYMGPSAQTGAGMQLMSRKPVKTLDDLKGVKVANPNRHGISQLNAWGAVPVQTGFGDLFTSLQNGTTDAVYWVDEAMIPFKIGTVLKHRTVLGITQTTIDLCANPKWVAALPADLRRNFELWLQVWAQSIGQIATTERTDLGVYDKLGVVSQRLAPEEHARWAKATTPIVEQWKAEARGRGYDPDRILAEIAALRARYDGMALDDMTRLTLRTPVQSFLAR